MGFIGNKILIILLINFHPLFALPFFANNQKKLFPKESIKTILVPKLWGPFLAAQSFKERKIKGTFDQKDNSVTHLKLLIENDLQFLHIDLHCNNNQKYLCPFNRREVCRSDGENNSQ